MAQIETLEIDEAHFFGFIEFFAGLDLFGEHAATRAFMRLQNAGALLERGAREVDLEDVGQRDERSARIVGHKVVERNGVSRHFQALAGGNDQIVGLDGFENFDDGLTRRQQGHAVFKQQIAGAVDEGTLAITKHVESDQQRAIERAAGGGFGIVGFEEVIDTIAKQKFVTEDVLVAIEDRLAGYETKVLRLGSVLRRLGLGRGVHP